MGDFYQELGVKRVINAAGTLTRLGGTPMDDDVLDAMREAAQWSVRMEELQEAAGITWHRSPGLKPVTSRPARPRPVGRYRRLPCRT